MKVYSLLGFNDYEGSELVGVFESVEDVMKCVESDNGKWFFDDMGYVESELGVKVKEILGSVEYVEFERYSYKDKVDV